MVRLIRESRAITDRPRQVTGVVDRGVGITEIAVTNNNITSGQPVCGELYAGKLFRRDKSTLTLVPIDGAKQNREQPSEQLDIRSTVLASIAYHNRAGIVLHKTGKSDLYQQRLPDFAGVSRATIQQAVSALLSSEDISDGPTGLHVTKVGQQ